MPIQQKRTPPVLLFILFAGWDDSKSSQQREREQTHFLCTGEENDIMKNSYVEVAS